MAPASRYGAKWALTVLIIAVSVGGNLGARAAGGAGRRGEQRYTEELLLRALPDGRVAADFAFTSRWTHPPSVPVEGGSGGGGADARPLRASEEAAFVQQTEAFPAALARAVRDAGVRELRVSLRRGRWEYGAWPPPAEPAPPGGELLVWLPVDADESTEAALAHALSGVFGASLNLATSTHPLTSAEASTASLASSGWTLREAERAREQAGVPSGAGGALRFLHGALPREALCTENLSPWARMLPCRARAGLATLLNPLRIFASRYHGLSTHVRQVCDDVEAAEAAGAAPRACARPVLEFRHTLSTVLDAEAAAGFLAGRPDPSLWPSNVTWSLESLFGRSLSGLCAAASDTRVYLELAPGDVDVTGTGAARSASLSPTAGLTLQPPPAEVLPYRGGDDATATTWLASWSLNDEAPARGEAWDVTYDRRAAREVAEEGKTPTLHFAAHRAVTGSGMLRRGLSTTLTNAGDGALNVTLVEVLPWFLLVKPRTHVLAVAPVPRDDGELDKVEAAARGAHCRAGEPGSCVARTSATPVHASPLVEEYDLRPGVSRGRPTTVETRLRVPARSSVELRIAFDVAFLAAEEFPADPNHGFEVPAATAWVELDTVGDASSSPARGVGDDAGHWSPLTPQGAGSGRGAGSWRRARAVPVHTPVTVVDMPLPDFSMPYNVVVLTSSVVAFLLGTVVNFLGRRRRTKGGSKPKGEQHAGGGLLAQLKARFGGK